MLLPSSSLSVQSTNATLAQSATTKPTAANGVKNYTFACGRGNFPNHIIAALKARGNWSQVAEEVAIENSNFYWRQLNLTF